MSDDDVARSLRTAADEAVRRPLPISLEKIRAAGDLRRSTSHRRRRRFGAALAVIAVAAAAAVPLPRLHLIGGRQDRPGAARARRNDREPPSWQVINYRGGPYRFDHPTTVFLHAHDVFVSNRDSITEIDADNGAIVRTISGRRDHFSSARSPAGALAVAGEHLWVTSGRDSLIEIDAGNGKWMRTLHGAYGFDLPVAGVFDGSHVWFANQGDSTVTEIDAASGSLVSVLGSPAYHFDDPDSMALSGSDLWIVNGESASVTEISTRTASVVRVLSGGSYRFDAPISIAFDGRDLWVVNYYEGDSVTEFAARNGAWVRTVSAKALGVKVPFSVAAGDGQVWLVADVVAEVNPASGRTERTFSKPAAAFDHIFGIAVGDGRVFVTSPGSNSLTEICRCRPRR